MPDSRGVCSRRVTIVNASGLHARSAASIARVAKEARSGIWVQRDTERADAKDIMDILSLGCQKGDVISVCVEDPSDRHVLMRLVTLVQNGFGE